MAGQSVLLASLYAKSVQWRNCARLHLFDQPDSLFRFASVYATLLSRKQVRNVLHDFPGDFV